MNFSSFFLCFLLVLVAFVTQAQSVAINQDGSDPESSAILDLQSTTQGFLVPRMTTAEREAIVGPAAGLLVYDTNTRSFWVFNSVMWMDLAVIRTLSDLDGDTRLSVEAMPDEDAIRMHLAGTHAMTIRRNAHGAVVTEPLDAGRSTIFGMEAGVNNTSSLGVSGDENTFIGYRSGHSNAEGRFNTFLGSQSGQNNTNGDQNTATGFLSLRSNTTGSQNSAYGVQALYSNSNGYSNSASGFQSLYANTTGDLNAAFGFLAMQNNIGGSENTAMGAQALGANTQGTRNTAAGYQAQYLNTEGYQNSAFGSQALYLNTVGVRNTAVGFQALYSNTTHSNTAVGYEALLNNSTGTPNTAMGFRALRQNSTGDHNSAYGYDALYDNTTGDFNTAIGHLALNAVTTQSFNTAVGGFAGRSYIATGSTFLGYEARANNDGYTNVTAIGYNARPGASNQIRLGNSNVSSIGGFEDWTNISDGRYKSSVQEDVAGLDFILQLRPVTYQLDAHRLAADLGEEIPADATSDYVDDIQSSRVAKSSTRYSGFIAQEVEAAAQELGFAFSGVDAPDNEGDFYGLRYATFVVPLVKAVQELAQENAQLRVNHATLMSEFEALKNRVTAMESTSDLSTEHTNGHEE